MNTETDITDAPATNDLAQAADDVAHAAGLRPETTETNNAAGTASRRDENPALNESRETNLEAPIIAMLRTCFDPEIPVDIYELGLIYGIDIEPSGDVKIRMTLTSPGCPVAGSLHGEVEQKVQSVPGVTTAKVELVWDPPWCMDNMSEAAKLQLGMD